MIHELDRYFLIDPRPNKDPSVLFAERIVPLKEFPNVGQLREELRGKATRGIIGLDVDRHLIDYQTGRPTDDGIYQAIQSCQEAGYLVYLSSFRPGGMLFPYHTEFKTDEPLIAENGGVVLLPLHHAELIYDLDSYARASFLRDQIKTRIIPSLEAKGYAVYHQEFTKDEPEVFTERLIDGSQEYSDYDAFVLVNARRRLGVTVFPFMFSQGEKELRHDEVYQLVFSELQAIDGEGRETPFFKYREVPEKPVFIAHSEGSSKTRAWQRLLVFMGGRKWVDGKRFYHLGDGLDDSINDSRIAFLVPANVDSGVRQNAKRVSEYPVTQGAIDNLNAILGGQV